MQQKECEEASKPNLDIIRTSVWEDWWKPRQPLSISGVWALIRTQDIQNMKQDCHMTTTILEKIYYSICVEIFWWDTTL